MEEKKIWRKGDLNFNICIAFYFCVGLLGFLDLIIERMLIYMCKKLTHEEFIQKVINKVGNKYIFHTKYQSGIKKIEIECKMDGFKWNPFAKDFLNGGCKCPQCSNCVKTKTTEHLKQEVFELVGNEYEVLGEYISAKEKIIFRHNKCGNEFPMNPNNFLNGHRCPICQIKQRTLKQTKTHEQFIKEVYNLHGNEYIVLNNYTGNKNDVKVQHTICGNIYLTKPSNILSKRHVCTCPLCSTVSPYTHEEIINEIFGLVGNEYSVLSQYTAMKDKIKMRHNNCGHEWWVNSWSFIKNNSRCPVCKNKSKGENKIKNYLNKNNINYQKQYSFKNCRYKRELPFDFAIFDEYNNIIRVIEYQGLQHYQIVSFGVKNYEKACKNYERTKITDKIKHDYCINNNIPILIIPYWEFKNVENILSKEIIV
jgi:predicted Zn-ribbon and HTH transcriptional regulator